MASRTRIREVDDLPVLTRDALFFPRRIATSAGTPLTTLMEPVAQHQIGALAQGRALRDGAADPCGEFAGGGMGTRGEG